MTQHTPGPWKVTDRPNDACCWNYHVETLERDTLMPRYAKDAIADVGTEANARLIAAAPEMLAFIKHLLDDGIILPNESAGKDIRALLAKIEGKA